MICLYPIYLTCLDEYEGGESNSDENVGEEAQEQVSTWRREFLLAVEQENYAIIPARPRPFPGLRSTRREEEVDKKTVRYTTSSSRKWYSNDCAIVVMNTSRYIVREVQGMLKPEGSDKEEIDFAVLEGRGFGSLPSLPLFARERRRCHQNSDCIYRSRPDVWNQALPYCSRRNTPALDANCPFALRRSACRGSYPSLGIPRLNIEAHMGQLW